jgi:hypothetical protein
VFFFFFLDNMAIITWESSPNPNPKGRHTHSLKRRRPL